MGEPSGWRPGGVVTLTTDFGQRDGYVGAMKGVLLSVASDLRLVDVAHEVPPQDVVHASATLEAATPWFPDGTVHLVVVDPGVGTERAPVVVTAGHHCFVGPDNGVMMAAARRVADEGQLGSPIAAYRIAVHPWLLGSRSATFHGRDVFAPTAAALAAGLIAPAGVGPAIEPKPMVLPAPVQTPDGVRGEVLWVDHFGNLVTSITQREMPPGAGAHCEVGAREVPLLTTYADAPSGQLVAVIGSGGCLEIAVRDGSAAATLGLSRGASVWLRSQPRLCDAADGR